MGTSITGYLSKEEIAQTKQQSQTMAGLGSGAPVSKFVFFAAFDGTNNDKDNVALSSDQWRKFF
jgi:hypothetical protein